MIAALIIYLAFLIIIAFRSARSVKDIPDFFVGDLGHMNDSVDPRLQFYQGPKWGQS